MRILLSLIFFISFNSFSMPPLIPSDEAERRIRMLDYDRNFSVVSFRMNKSTKKFDIFDIKLSSISPVTKKPFFTEFFWYRPKMAGNPKPLPVIIISPPIVGVDPMEKLIATAFAGGEAPYYNTLILNYGEKINDKNRPINSLNDSFIKTITQGRLLLDFIQTQSKFVDVNKIACYGMSLGGVMSSLLLEIDSRVKAAVVIVGGGNFPEIMRNSNQSIVRGYREARMKAENLRSLDELEQKVRDSFLFDPLFFASRRATRDIYMVIALEDTAVPTKNQLELYEAFRRPQGIKYHADHAPTIFKNLPRHEPVMKYLEWRLGLEK